MKRSEKNHKDSSTGDCGGHQRGEEGFQECHEDEGGYKWERKQRGKLSSNNLRL